MTGLLASVNSLTEAKLILATSVDIIDLKQPEQGALGALPVELVGKIVRQVAGKKLVSATVGDLPMQADLVFDAVIAMAETGVDYIKIGFFPEGDWQAVIDRLAELTQQGAQLVAVLFADTQPDLDFITALKRGGFIGVMLDTMNKSAGSLVQVMSYEIISEFIHISKQQQLLCGLAGSLKQTDIAVLLALNPDYLGFRGALCTNQQRTATLNRSAVISIAQCF